MQQRFPDLYPDIVTKLKSRYDAPGRAYHNWAHIQALLGHFERAADLLAAPHAVEIALYYHDVIYVPGSTSNEADSADAMLAEMSERADSKVLKTADLIIRATAAHAVPDGANREDSADCALFLDMDLAILGARPEAFDAFDAAIRQEFSMVPDEIFYPRRRAVMQGFLERERIYLTDLFHDSLDQSARENLNLLVQRLS